MVYLQPNRQLSPKPNRNNKVRLVCARLYPGILITKVGYVKRKCVASRFAYPVAKIEPVSVLKSQKSASVKNSKSNEYPKVRIGILSTCTQTQMSTTHISVRHTWYFEFRIWVLLNSNSNELVPTYNPMSRSICVLKLSTYSVLTRTYLKSLSSNHT